MEASSDETVNGSAGDRQPGFSFSDSPSMEDIRRLQAKFTNERDWNKFHQPRSLLLALVGEVGELAELFQWQGEVPEGLPGWSPSQREALSHELSDVLIYLLELAEKCHVDLPRAVLSKLELNTKKYPAGRVHGSAKKYTEYGAEEARGAP
ncbi:dCTP pyrophosphatase 1 [Discoglossus pictus]